MKGFFSLKIFAIAAVIAVAIAYALFGTPEKFPLPSADEKGLDNLAPSERLNMKKNIVVLGVDERTEENDVGRSDTLFVVMFDTDKKSASLLSIPRDTRVRIKGYGWDKINHAYAFGGRELTQRTVEELLGLKINNYVMVDFKGFTGLVDAIGGVDIDVEKDMYYYDYWDGFKIDLKKGRQHLDGKSAIQYVRYRDEDGDIGLIARQQHFLMAVYDKISSANMLLRIPGLAKQITSMVQTDMPLSDMVDLGRVLHTMVKEHGVAMASVQGTPVYIDEISYWIPDITDLREQMVKMQGAEMTEHYRSAAELMEREYKVALQEAEEKEQEEKAEQEEEAEKPQKAVGRNDKKLSAEEKAMQKKKDRKNRNEKQTVKSAKAKPGEKAESSAAVSAEAKVQAKKKSTAAQRTGIVVRLVNCSGSSSAASSAIARLQKEGFTVINGGSGNLLSQTTVVSTTNNGAVVARLSKVPFDHKISINRDGAGDCDGVIMLGTDYK